MGYLDRYYDEGYQARLSGHKHNDCPYESNSIEAREWRHGYADANSEYRAKGGK